MEVRAGGLACKASMVGGWTAILHYIDAQCGLQRGDQNTNAGQTNGHNISTDL